MRLRIGGGILLVLSKRGGGRTSENAPASSFGRVDRVDRVDKWISDTWMPEINGVDQPLSRIHRGRSGRETGCGSLSGRALPARSQPLVLSPLSLRDSLPGSLKASPALQPLLQPHQRVPGGSEDASYRPIGIPPASHESQPLRL